MKVIVPKTKEECIDKLEETKNIVKRLEKIKDIYYAEGRRIRKLIDMTQNIQCYYARHLFSMNKEEDDKKPK